MSVAQYGGGVAAATPDVEQERRSGRTGYLLLLPGILWLLVFFVLPTIQLAATGAVTTRTARSRPATR